MGKTDLSRTPLSKIYLLPNLLTAGNLFFGFLCIIRCIQAKYCEGDSSSHYYNQAVWCIFGSLVCDGLDGRVARLGGKESLFGKEFDSIADVISFGVAPAMMVFFLILSPTHNYPFFRKIGWIIGFIYLLCGAVRLARFNVITHPLLIENKQLSPKRSYCFIGLPIPAAAGVIASLVLVINRFDLKSWALLLPGLMLLIAWLMVSNIHYPSFKHIDWNTEMRFRTFVGIVAIGAVIYFFKEFSCAILSLSYVFFGLVRHIRHHFKSLKD
ncbi:MAG: CDP-diacylglycerol--serine O-phosphatidyltransferase [Puniceicoccales bacterium]|jgi:CDP-diacylglycerol--serine O-phosphatidyltransferase|nr:CDP-diacylglycerol--serine O-phosphatidyltransferase [Puniceicoccales bacterium]